MPETKTKCTKCGAEIQQATARRTGGLCMPCKDGRIVRRNRVEITPERKRAIDWMCILIEKLSEDDEKVEYQFSADIYEPDPLHRHGSQIVGQAHGVLSVDKASGEIVLVEAMQGDDNERRFSSAAQKIKKHWEAGEFPDKTMYACG